MRILFTIGILFVFLGCDRPGAWDCVQTTGDLIEEIISTESTIKQVIIFDDVNLFWHPPQEPGEQLFIIETGDNLIGEVEAKVVADSILQVRNNNSCRWTRAPRTLTLHVYSDSINWIEKQGFGEINTTEQVSINHRLDVITLGSGNVTLDIDNPNALWLSMQSLSNVTLTGRLTTLHALVDQRVDGILYAEELDVQDVSVWHAGTNEIHVAPSDILRGTIRGNGNVNLYREPLRGVEVNQEGSGVVIFRF